MNRLTLIVSACLLFAANAAFAVVADEPFSTDLKLCECDVIGQVLVWNDCEKLYIQIVVGDCTCVVHSHVHVAENCCAIPQMRSGKPLLYKFDYQDMLYIEIPLGDWEPGTELCIAAHALVTTPRAEWPCFCCPKLRDAWGVGCRFCDRCAMYFRYTIQPCVPPPPCPNPQLENGGFESPTVTADQGWDIFSSGQVDWTVTWGDAAEPQLELMTTGPVGEIPNGWAAHGGSQWAELDSDFDGPAGSTHNEPASVRISQDVVTCEGEEYTVTFYYSARPGHDDNKLQVYWNGTEALPEIVVDGSALAGTDWQMGQVMNLPGAAGSSTLAFEETGAPDSRGMFLDDVSVVKE